MRVLALVSHCGFGKRKSRFSDIVYLVARIVCLSRRSNYLDLYLGS